MTALSALRGLEPQARPSAADQVFQALHDRIIALDLPPGTRLSEAEVAQRLGVSRQPVRDAFHRLSQRGFLVIRPQRATTVAPISEPLVEQARFIRAAIEAETTRLACALMTDDRRAGLEALIARQRAAVAAGDSRDFHALDDAFHREICVAAGHAHAWTVIRESKAHTDRVRLLTLPQGSQAALDEHLRVMDAFAAGDGEAAAEAMRRHLSRLQSLIPGIRAAHGAYFEDATDAR